MIAFILAPKNSGLLRYREKALRYLSKAGLAPRPSAVVEVRGEDVPFLVQRFSAKGRKAIGLTGEDLYREYCLRKGAKKLRILKRIAWKDPAALFRKPALCLLGPVDKALESLSNPSVCITSKYRRIALEYLRENGFSFDTVFVTGSSEPAYGQGLATLLIDIVYTGDSMRKAGLRVYGKIMESDFLIVGAQDE